MRHIRVERMKEVSWQEVQFYGVILLIVREQILQTISISDPVVFQPFPEAPSDNVDGRGRPIVFILSVEVVPSGVQQSLTFSKPGPGFYISSHRGLEGCRNQK